MKEKEIHTHAQTRDADFIPTPSFEDFMKAVGDMCGEVTYWASKAAEEKWRTLPAIKKITLVEKIKTGEWKKPRLDWLIDDFVVPEPEFLHGDEAQDVVQVKYNGGFRLCSRETQRLYNLEFVREWNSVHPDDR